VAFAVEAVHFAVGNAIRQAGGRDSDYLGVEIRLAWVMRLCAHKLLIIFDKLASRVATE
jgi:hypothetical protein